MKTKLSWLSSYKILFCRIKKKKCLDARANLLHRFEDWFYEECRIKKAKKPQLRKPLQADEMKKILFRNMS